MEINTPTRPAAANDMAAVANAAASSVKFKERRLREAQSDVRNEAVFFSPVIKIDRETQAAVIQFRDSETGEVVNEYPNKKAANVYERADKTADKTAGKTVEKAEVKAVAEDKETVQEPEVHVDEDA